MGVFAKKDEESFQEYRERVINKLSQSFCGAKWYNATIWLGKGTTEVVITHRHIKYL